MNFLELRKRENRENLERFYNSLGVLVEQDKTGTNHDDLWEKWYFDNQIRNFEVTNIPLYLLRCWLRDNDKKIDVLKNKNDIRNQYFYRCLGHKVNLKTFFKSPRLCVLVAKRVVGDRWREAEEFISECPMSCYLYSRYVLEDRLPVNLHNKLVLNSFVKKDFIVDRYFREFG